MSTRGRDGGGEAPEPMAGEDLVSLLYGEMEPDEAERTGARVASDPALSARLGEMRRVRDLFSSLEEEDPPSRLTAQLMAEAARAAPQPRRAAAPAEAGLWSRFISWLQPLAQRPALAAAASLVLVAGVAGVLYMRKGDELTSTAPPPAAETETAVDGNAAGTAAQPAVPPPVTAATAEAEIGEDRGGQADGDDSMAPAEEPAKSDPASSREDKPTAKRRKSSSAAPGSKNAYDKAPAKPAVKSGTVYGLSEQEMVPREQAQAGSEGGGGSAGDAEKKADEAPAPQAPPAPTPSTAPANDSKAPAPSRPDVRDLHKRAIDAALDNRCSEVKTLAGQVRATDSAYYAKSFAGDQRLQKCLATPSRAKK